MIRSRMNYIGMFLSALVCWSCSAVSPQSKDLRDFFNDCSVVITPLPEYDQPLVLLAQRPVWTYEPKDEENRTHENADEDNAFHLIEIIFSAPRGGTLRTSTLGSNDSGYATKAEIEPFKRYHLFFVVEDTKENTGRKDAVYLAVVDSLKWKESGSYAWLISNVKDPNDSGIRVLELVVEGRLRGVDKSKSRAKLKIDKKNSRIVLKYGGWFRSIEASVYEQLLGD